MYRKKKYLIRIYLGFFLFSILIGIGFASSDLLRLKAQKKQNNLWKKYLSSEEAGWSSVKLKKAEEYAKDIGSAAVMVVYKANVLFSRGDIKRRFMCHSIRKSFMSLMYGIYINNGLININKTIRELNIDDLILLSDNEKKASISDLLKARSGIYHTAAYEPGSMVKTRPERGSHKSGSFWFYNNWDFNTLCTIFEHETGKKFFIDFKNKIANKIEMEDFRLIDTYYHYEKNRSIHPAYPFKMSTRDMARIGVLLLKNGVWNKKKIIPEKWIRESTKIHSKTLWRRGHYGYMWWISKDKDLRSIGVYSAIGASGHRLDILPGADLVFVHRVNSYKNKRIKNTDIDRLLKLILNARTNKGKKKPKLIDLMVYSKKKERENLIKEQLNQYLGTYKLNSGFFAKIKIYKKRLMVFFPDIGKFRMIKEFENKYILEDILIPLKFQKDKIGKIKNIEIGFYSGVEIGIPIAEKGNQFN